MLILKELNLISFVASLFEILYTFLVAVCFVLVFEPVIEKMPLKSRNMRCTFVYLSLFVLILIAGSLLVPVIVNEWDKLKELLQMVFSIHSKDSETVFSYESALASTLQLAGSLKDVIFSYLLAYFISFEYDDIKRYLFKWSFFSRFFLVYDKFKEYVFLYLKALLVDVFVLFFAQLIILNVFDVSYSLFLALGLALLNVIPYFGSFIGQLLIFLIDYLTTGEIRVFLVLCVFIIQQIESNALQPVLFSRMMNIRPLYLFAAILSFGKILGFAGFLFAPVFAAAIQFALCGLSHTDENQLDES